MVSGLRPTITKVHLALNNYKVHFMSNLQFHIEPGAWQMIKNDSFTYLMGYDFQMLGWDREAQTIDFALRFDDKGGHCQRHRHLASTTVLVMEGEQHLTEIHSSGKTTSKKRIKGEYARSDGADQNPHMERGGPDGGVVFYSCYAPDGRLFELIDDDGTIIREVTFEDMIEAWEHYQEEVRA